MKTTLYFDMAIVARLIDHAEQSTERRGTIAQLYDGNFQEIPDPVIPPGLNWAKDRGIYLMSNGKLGEGGDAAEMGLIAYARGFNPEANPDYYWKQTDAVGGDDFVEFLGLEWVKRVVGDRTSGYLAIEVTREHFSIDWVPAKR
jgi:hypothetical protein